MKWASVLSLSLSLSMCLGLNLATVGVWSAPTFASSHLGSPRADSVFSTQTFSTQTFSSQTTDELFWVKNFPWPKFIKNNGGSSMKLGVLFAGPDPYETNPDVSFVPASNTKLFTSTAVLELLGSEFQFITRLKWNLVHSGDPSIIQDLVLEGSGDPSWEVTRFRDFAHALYDQGIREVRGAVLAMVSDSRWLEITYPKGWEWKDTVNCYGTPSQGFTIQQNCAVFTISGLKKGAWNEFGVPTDVEVNLTSSTVTDVDLEIIGDPSTGKARYSITGKYRVRDGKYSLIMPVLNTRTWAENLLDQALRDAGIRRVKSSSALTMPNSFDAQLEMASEPLSQIIVPFMKDSINVIGDTLYKYLGARFGSKTDTLWDAGRSVMDSFLSGLPVPGTELEDGSGLSRNNYTTAQALIGLLERNKTRAGLFPSLWNALPIAGQDGTLKNRMQGTAAQGVLRAKTGTLSGVSNLSGYVPLRSGDYLPFVLLVEAARTSDARHLQDLIGAKLTELARTSAR